MHTEAAQADGSSDPFTPGMPSNYLSYPLSQTLAREQHHSAPRFDFYADPMSVFSENKSRDAPSDWGYSSHVAPPVNSILPELICPPSQAGVSNCYVFKSRLQEYAQKVGVTTPVYDTIKEGPSHEPYFKSSVIVNDVRYDSLPGFANRKAAEQSAAEVALRELAKCSKVNQCISQPLHETGLCKNLLQEYAQKMNYAIPLYQCQKEDANSTGKSILFQCTIEIGGIRYIGAAAKTKKEAEIKAARTALLAIQSTASKSVEETQLTVLPCKKRPPEPISVSDVPALPKAKKRRFKKKTRFPKKGRTGKVKVNGQSQTQSDSPTVGPPADPIFNGSSKTVSEVAGDFDVIL